MKNLYQTIKKTAREYAFPVIIAGTMALGNINYSNTQKSNSTFDYQSSLEKELISEVKIKENNYKCKAGIMDELVVIGALILPVMFIVMLFGSIYIGHKEDREKENSS